MSAPNAEQMGVDSMDVWHATVRTRDGRPRTLNLDDLENAADVRQALQLAQGRLAS